MKGQLAFLQQQYEVVAVSGEDDHLRTVAKREQVRTVNIPMQRNISPIQDLVSLWQLYVLFIKEKPQIVHSITPKAGLLSMLAAKLAGVPVRMHTFTGLVFPTKKGFLQQLLISMDRLLCSAATNIYPEGLGVKNDLLAYNITNKPLKILANGNVNGIDTAYFTKEQVSNTEQEALRNELGICKNDFVFIFVGRLVGDKGINELVHAFSQLNISSSEVENTSTNGELKLLLVGPLESQLDPLLPETLQTMAKNKNIISVGFQLEVRSYYAIANALVFPSYREGFPNVVLQAGAMGLPSIVTDINGSNEIIVNGKNGLIIPVKDEVAICEAMQKIVEDSNLYTELKRNSREMIVFRYEQQLVWDAIAMEYKIAMKNV
ncbi:glycosyltransferase family 4 protein [Flavobacterium sp. F-380]|uniref:Glycosyltransferase family 4 protein n=1 Tax=Flavobacterium kayseriense TaxID=2764714 RepID=A0ABR7J7D9_9FLAO|nr:glycosyltransferase family 4 protein [Flavobacterium kayseriense]MBC5847987.1 glycosyltransferase family 4 protein [Flavobacterium kayseriense]